MESCRQDRESGACDITDSAELPRCVESLCSHAGGRCLKSRWSQWVTCWSTDKVMDRLKYFLSVQASKMSRFIWFGEETEKPFPKRECGLVLGGVGFEVRMNFSKAQIALCYQRAIWCCTSSVASQSLSSSSEDWEHWPMQSWSGDGKCGNAREALSKLALWTLKAREVMPLEQHQWLPRM